MREAWYSCGILRISDVSSLLNSQLVTEKVKIDEKIHKSLNLRLDPFLGFFDILLTTCDLAIDNKR